MRIQILLASKIYERKIPEPGPNPETAVLRDFIGVSNIRVKYSSHENLIRSP